MRGSRRRRSGAVETDAARIAPLLPDDLLKELPAAPAFARSFPLGEDLTLTLIWCDAEASADLAEAHQRHLLEEIAAVSQLAREVHFLEGDVERLRAVVNDEVLADRIDRYRLVKQYIHADGHLIWGDLTVSCLRDAHGEVEYFVSQIIDITKEVEDPPAGGSARSAEPGTGTTAPEANRAPAIGVEDCRRLRHLTASGGPRRSG